MPLINRKINLILTWLVKCAISEVDRVTAFATTDIKLHVSVVTLSTQGIRKLLQQLLSGFKCTIHWNKYQLKVTIKNQNQYLDYSIHSSFQGVNTLFVLSLENNAHQARHIG